jgi:hypothetical protein
MSQLMTEGTGMVCLPVKLGFSLYFISSDIEDTLDAAGHIGFISNTSYVHPVFILTFVLQVLPPPNGRRVCFLPESRTRPGSKRFSLKTFYKVIATTGRCN